MCHMHAQIATVSFELPLIFSCYVSYKENGKNNVCLLSNGNIFDSKREVKWRWHENYLVCELFYQYFLLPDVFFSPNKEFKNKMCLSNFISGKIGKLHWNQCDKW